MISNRINVGNTRTIVIPDRSEPFVSGRHFGLNGGSDLGGRIVFSGRQIKGLLSKRPNEDPMDRHNVYAFDAIFPNGLLDLMEFLSINEANFRFSDLHYLILHPYSGICHYGFINLFFFRFDDDDNTHPVIVVRTNNGWDIYEYDNLKKETTDLPIRVFLDKPSIRALIGPSSNRGLLGKIFKNLTLIFSR